MNFIICSCETVGLCGVWRVGPICGFGISNGVGLWWWFGMGFDYLWKSSPIKAYCATISTDNTFHFKKMSTNPPNIAIKNPPISLLLRHSLPPSPSYHLIPRHAKTFQKYSWRKHPKYSLPLTIYWDHYLGHDCKVSVNYRSPGSTLKSQPYIRYKMQCWNLF